MYESFYGLREKPFNIAPDPAFLFLSSIHQEALANLKYGIREGVGFVVLTGEVGTGKTLLLHALLRSLDETVKSAYIFYPKISFKDMLRFILNELEIPIAAGEVSDMLTQLNDYLIERFRQNQSTVLIIDEAQDLDDDLLENIRLLSNLETAKSKLLTIILVGQPELHRKLERPELRQLKQRIVVRFHLTPLDRGEVKAYIHHRLRAAGAVRPDLFNDKAIARIASYSDGVPRLINIICDNALLLGFAEEEEVIGVSMIEEAIRDLEGGPLATSPQRMARKAGRSASKRWRKVAVTALIIMAVMVAAGAGVPPLVKWLLAKGPDRLPVNGGPPDKSPIIIPDATNLLQITPTLSPEAQFFASSDTPVATYTALVSRETPLLMSSKIPTPTLPIELINRPSVMITASPSPTVTITQPTHTPSLTPYPPSSPEATALPVALVSPTGIVSGTEALAEGLLLGGSEMAAATEAVTDASLSLSVSTDGTKLHDLRVFQAKEAAVISGASYEVAVQVASLLEPARVKASMGLVESLGATALAAKPYLSDRGTRWIRIFAIGFKTEEEAQAFLERALKNNEIRDAKPFRVYILREEDGRETP